MTDAAASEDATRQGSLRALDGLNFLVADVATGLGPFLAIFLAGRDGWTATNIGFVLSAASIAGLITQTPLGMLVDATRYKRALLAAAVAMVGIASVAMTIDASFFSVVAVQSAYGVAGAAIGPAMAAITLGLVGPKRFGRVQGRVQAWNHAGNVFAALIAGWLGQRLGMNGVLWFTVVMACATLLTLVAVRPGDIDHTAARGGQDDGKSASWHSLLSNRNLLVLMAAFFLFHFANAAMLPLAGMKLAAGKGDSAAPLMSACIVGAQLVMVPVAAVAGRLAERFGWKPVLAVGFGVLAVRGVLYPLSDSAVWIIGVQLLDGIGAGLFGVLGLVAVAEVTRGSGRFNAAQGLASTFVGIGATVSTVVSGWMVDHVGYGFAFTALAGTALVALLVLLLGVRAASPTGPAGRAPSAVPT